MTIYIEAPYEAPTVGLVLPNPNHADERGLDAEVEVRVSMGSIVRTYVKDPNQYNLRYRFRHLHRQKQIEVQEFAKVFFAADIKITDHNNVIWKMKFSDNNIDVALDSKSKPCGTGQKEKGIFAVLFTGSKISA